ncbi:MAG: alpha/beta hydrolase [Promethearchaeota archaeon]
MSLEKEVEILPGAGPFHFEGNDIGIIMIHGGGGGTCADLKPLAEDLNKIGGYTISLPLLPGFGTSPEKLQTTTIEEWKKAVELEFKSLQQKCSKVFVGGHSMGGVLTLILASKVNLTGLFTISAPIGIKGIAIKLVPLIKLFMKYYPVNIEEFKKQTKGKWVGYDKIPLNIVKKFKKLINEMKSSLDKVKSPAILFQGIKDEVINDNSMDYIYDKIRSEYKKKVWLKNNEHAILDCPDHDIIVSELHAFFTKICQQS